MKKNPIKSSEKLVLRAVLDYLTYRQYFFWRNNTGAFKTERGGFYKFGDAGSPDVCLIKSGKFIGLEVKDKAKQSEAQKDWQARCEEAGGQYYIVRSIDDLVKLKL